MAVGASDWAFSESAGVGSSTSPEENRDVWVIVPCFNEASVVGGVVRRLVAVFPNVVVVDDGSSDGSDEQVRNTGARVVRHALNLGYGAALQTGLRYALLDPRAQYFLFFDADGQHRVTDAADMIVRMRHEEIEVLIGSRFLGSAPGLPRVRRALLRAAGVFERLLSGVRVTDAHNGLRAFTRHFASRIDLVTNDMAYASDFLRLVGRSGLSCAEHPVTVDYTSYSLSKGQRSVNSINIAIDVLMRRAFGRRFR